MPPSRDASSSCFSRRLALARGLSASCLCLLLAQLPTQPATAASAAWFERGPRQLSGRTVDIRDFGAVPNVSDVDTAVKNADAMTAALGNLTSGDTFLVPEGLEFYAVGGILGVGLTDVQLQFDGTLRAVADFEHWPVQGNGNAGYAHFINLVNSSFITLRGSRATDTSGLIDGNGKKWWNAFILGQLKMHRPKLVVLDGCTNVLITDLLLHSSPSFHIDLLGVAEAEIANITIETDRKETQESKALLRSRWVSQGLKFGGEPGLEPEDLNTDGIDPSGRDVWIHDCSILNDDDSIAVKPCSKDPSSCYFSNCSENMLIERLVLTGFGASIGSVPPKESVNCVRNITFRDISMPKTGKGVYIKSNPSCDRPNATSVIADIAYENIDILEPSWWPIWIGPQQQHEPNSALGEKCALAYPVVNQCPTQGCVTFVNISLRNIYIEDPHMSPGVILGNSTNPMRNVSFYNVTVRNPGVFPFNKKYQCENVDIHAVDCDPMPVCV